MARQHPVIDEDERAELAVVAEAFFTLVEITALDLRRHSRTPFTVLYLSDMNPDDENLFVAGIDAATSPSVTPRGASYS